MKNLFAIKKTFYSILLSFIAGLGRVTLRDSEA
jgi:hypothetical protein